MDNNESLRKDEIEALSAIYGDDIILEDSDSNVFSITLNHPDEPEKSIQLEIRLSTDYPLYGPPYYTLSAPWMSRLLKTSLTSDLDSIYLDNKGESILYMWIEKAREYLDDDKVNCQLSGNGNQQQQQRSNSGDGQVSNDEKPNEDGNSINSLNNLDSDKTEEDEVSPENDYEYKYGDYSYQQDSHQSHHHYHHHHHHKENGVDVDINLFHGEPIVDRRSVFQAHLCPVDCLNQVNSALAQLKANKKIASATHNISAYRIIGGANHSFIQDCDDDGETHAGGRLLHLLQLLDVKNVLVVVSRWYGGVNLGADRFKHINNAARELLVKCGYIDNQASNNSSTDSKQSTGRKKKSK